MPSGGAVIDEEDRRIQRRRAARARVADRHRAIVHSGGNLELYYAQHFQGAVFPLSAGLLFYGWRAAFALLLVLIPAAVAGAVWHRVGRRGRDMTMLHAMWMALLL